MLCSIVVVVVSMLAFVVYRVSLMPTLYEVQRSFGWIACWSGFIAAFPALQSSMLVKVIECGVVELWSRLVVE